MSAYLQRLFDRAAPSAPQPAPTGASLSPLAESDQRMNDPQFAGLFGLGFGRADDAESDGDASPLRPDARLPPAPRATPMPAPPPTHQEPRAAPEQSPSRASEPRSAPAIPPFLDVGRIFPDDLQLPDTATERAQSPHAPAVPPSPPLAAPVMPSTVAASHDEAAIARPAPVAAPRDSPATPEPVHTRAQTEPVRDRAEPAAPVEPKPADTAAPPPATERSDEPATERDAAPVMMMPPRVTPQPIAAPETAAASPVAPRPAPPPPPRPVREVRAAEQSKPDTPAQKRPMTAATASLIGPLVAQPRARTLFGLRRR